MKLITKEIEKQLRDNDWREETAFNADESANTKPVLKLFNPCGAATWLITSIDEDGDRMFGLCDMGFGSPELGYVSLKEVKAIRTKPFGLGIERDMHWNNGGHSLDAFAAAARDRGAIVDRL